MSPTMVLKALAADTQSISCLLMWMQLPHCQSKHLCTGSFWKSAFCRQFREILQSRVNFLWTASDSLAQVNLQWGEGGN